MTQNKLFRECLAQITPQTRREFDFIFSVAEKIVSAMNKKNITKKDLASGMNVSEATVNKWLTGRYDFSLSQLFGISEIIGEPLVKFN